MFDLLKVAYKIVGDTSQSDAALDSTGKKAEKTTSELSKYIDKFNSWVTGLVSVTAVVSGLKKVWEISSSVADLGDSIDKGSQKFHLSKERYQEYAFIAEHFGFTIDQLGDSVVELSKKVGEGKNDTINGLLEELGIDLADAMTATPEDLFAKVVEGLQEMEDSTRKVYIADQLFGGGAKEMTPWLNATKDATQELIDQLHALNGTMSETLVNATAEYKDALTNYETALQGLKNKLGEETVPAMTKIVKGLTDMLTGDFADGLKTAADGLEDYFKAIANGLSKILEPPVIELTNWVIDKFSGLPGISESTKDDMALVRQASEEGKPWWELAGYIADPVFAAGNDDVPRSMGISTANVGKLALDTYTYMARGGSKYDFLEAIEDKYDNATMENVADALDRLESKITDFVDSGGNIEDFWAQMRELYGDSVDGVVAAIDDNAAQWDQATLDYAAANINAINSINAAAEKFLETYGSPYVDGERSGRAGKFAVGLPFVPRDDFPARLHYGERVLTRQENESYSKGQGVGGNTTINIQTVAQSPAQTAAAITAALARARWAM